MTCFRDLLDRVVSRKRKFIQIHEQVKFAADGTRRRSVRVGHIRINRDADLLGHLSTCDAELIHPRASSWGSMTIIQ